jgi:hypothetical protein
MTSRETITLDARAQQRLTVLTHVLAGELTLDQAAAYLRLSTRQVRRLLVELRGEGAAALVHGNRGRAPANRVDEDTATRVVELARTTYAGFNPVHLAECLADDPDEPLSSRRGRCTGSSPEQASSRPGPGVGDLVTGGASGCPARGCCSRPTDRGMTGLRVGDPGSPSSVASTTRRAP